MKTFLLLVTLFTLSTASAQTSVVPIPAWDYYEEPSAFDSITFVELIELKASPSGKFYREHWYSRKRQTYYLDGILRGNGIDTTLIGRRFMVPEEQAKTLRNILKDYSDSNFYTNVCYMPRNGILFYNKRHELISYLEICYECHQAYYKGCQPIEENHLTDAQFILLKEQFIASGLKID